jgi:CheY-like chemotaxis protein
VNHNARTSVTPVEILYVEDNPADIRLTREVLAEGRVMNSLHVVTDGEQALAYVRGEGPFADRVVPDLILLDLNLPRRDGREVLAELKSDPSYRQIPVVVLTTSNAERDILQSYTLHANCFITKPVDLNQFMNVIRAIEDFWLSIVRLPPSS